MAWCWLGEVAVSAFGQKELFFVGCAVAVWQFWRGDKRWVVWGFVLRVNTADGKGGAVPIAIGNGIDCMFAGALRRGWSGEVQRSSSEVMRGE